MHVGSHQRSVGVVVLEEGDQSGRHTDHLARRHVDVLNLVGRHHLEVAVVSGNDRIADQAAVLDLSIGRGQSGLVLLIRAEPLDLLGQLAAFDLLVRRDQETVLIHASVDRQARNQTDVRTFRRLDRADAAVVRNVHVADFKAGSLAIQTARAQCRQTPLVRQHRQRVGLIDHLRQFAAAEEVFDRRGDALRVHKASRGHVLDVLQAHSLLDGAAKLQEALAQLIAGQFVDRAKTSIAQVIDVVDLGRRLVAPQVHKILNRGNQVLGSQRHLVFADFQTQFPIDAEPAYATQPIAIRVVELLEEQRLGLFQGWGGLPGRSR